MWMPPAEPAVDLRQLVRDVPDFPKPGILFRDLTPLMRDPAVWQEVIRQFNPMPSQACGLF